MAKKLSLGGPDEDMAALNPRMQSGRNRSKRKHEETRYTDLGGSGGLYSNKFRNQRRYREETWSETGSEAPTPHGGAAKGGPALGHGVVPSGTVSCPVSSRNFLYFLKREKYLRKVKSQTFSYHNRYLDGDRLYGFLNLLANENLRSHHLYSINIFINRIS